MRGVKEENEQGLDIVTTAPLSLVSFSDDEVKKMILFLLLLLLLRSFSSVTDSTPGIMKSERGEPVPIDFVWNCTPQTLLFCYISYLQRTSVN